MKKLILYSSIIIAFAACKKDGQIIPGTNYDDWTNATHGMGATPDYSVFDGEKVHRMDIVVGADYWQVMQDDLETLYGASTQGPPVQGVSPFSDVNPIYIPCQVFYDGKQWYDVGIRYKGNSSLRFAYQNGKGKLPFRLQFNKFEDENPLIFGQTFYGFKELSFSSAYNDNSLIREKIVPELYREFGVPSARTAFYRIYVDFGEGPVYFGLYTMVEVIFDSMVGSQYTSGGNTYKPDSDGAHLNDLASITAEFIDNKTTPGDVSEIANLVSAIIDPIRQSNPSQWRTQLEEILDVPLFLKYLAANTTIGSWDTYGIAAHNYYLYNNPTDGKIKWIPWDNNQALSTASGKSPLFFNFSNMTNQQPTSSGDHTWPLIAYLYNDPVYRVQYQQYIDEFIFGAFSTSNVQNRINVNSALIEPYVTGAEGEQGVYTYLNSPSDFTSEISYLINYVQTRWNLADAYTP